MKQRNSLLAVVAADRPPEMPIIGAGADWKFEIRALADEFKHFTVDALASSQPTISIFDYIGDDGEGGGVTTKRIGAALRQIGEKPIRVEINSPGGDYFEGVAIFNQLRRHPGEITVQILGVAASAASVIAMAGDRIEIAQNAELMIHEARGLTFGTKTDHQANLDTLAHIDRAMCETYAARSGRDAAEFEAMIAGKDVFLRGQAAIDMGLADALLEREAQMPVYASNEQFPSDETSLDQYLAERKMPRAERRNLLKALTGGESSRQPVEARRAEDGIAEADVSRLLAALTV